MCTLLSCDGSPSRVFRVLRPMSIFCNASWRKKHRDIWPVRADWLPPRLPSHEAKSGQNRAKIRVLQIRAQIEPTTRWGCIAPGEKFLPLPLVLVAWRGTIRSEMMRGIRTVRRLTQWGGLKRRFFRNHPLMFCSSPPRLNNAPRSVWRCS